MHRIKTLLLILLVGGAIALAGRAQPAFSNAVNLGMVSFNSLHQASGVTASCNNPGVLWTHNDAGDTARIFAIDTNGNHLATFDLTNATHVDYEDIALGPGPLTNVQYIYVGDIGDNNSSRSNIVIYQAPEPAVYLRWATNSNTQDLPGVRAITFVYPDGPRNAEALLLDPITHDLFIASKETNLSRIYVATRAQLDAGGTNTLTFVRQIDFNLASGGAVSPIGGEIVLRQEDFARLWIRAPGQTVSNALGGTPIPIPVVGRTNEPNGEAIGFDTIGRGYFTLSDSASSQPLYYFDRATPYAIKPPRTLVTAGSTWRYLDTGTNLGTGWRTNGFNDSGWSSGEAQFGYGDGDEETVVSYGPSKKNKFITTYFRKQFVTANLANISRLELKLVFDDGAAVFLNGTQIALMNLTNNAAYNSFATNTQDLLQATWFTFPVNPTLLRNGTNVLAAEVHQATTNSPDLSFDAQLVAYDLIAPEILSESCQPGGAFAFTFLATGTNAMIEMATNLPNWSPLTSVPITNGLGSFVDRGTTNGPRRYYRLRQ